MYKSPIEIITENAKMIADDNAYKAVTQYGFEVDKDELIKALRYDRGQYDTGFKDGYETRDNEIIRCKDCKWYRKPYGGKEVLCTFWLDWIPTEEDDFCSYAERKEDE